jgi:alginate O-acetyltransferase complex protein AlgI
MVFSSQLFIFYFLPLVLGIYYVSPRRTRHILLTLLSYIFYGWANPYFVGLMLTSTIIDYICGLVIARQFGRKWDSPIEPLEVGGRRSRAQKTALVVSIITNLSLLGFFKYFNFGVDSYNQMMTAVGGQGWETFWRITLPLGISFYTFQSMSYSIDVYRGDARAIRNFTDFSCYVAMFPQLVAGPIVRFHEVAEQLRERTHTAEKFARGVAFFSMGLAKKVLLANPCGKVADMVFDAGSATVLDSWYGGTAYAFQIYFDFSAYSDMAIGLGLFFGFVFPKNFDSPYLSKSITEFWQRWHLSLSNWLRDYLYIPLGGNRKGNARTYVNLAMVMLLGGLWHGAAWNFVVWGAIHGAMLGFERLQGKDSFYRKLPGPIRTAVTFAIVVVAWVFFRARDIGSAGNFIANMFGMGPAQEGTGLVAGLIYQPYYVLSFLLAVGITWFAPQTWDFTRRLSPVRATCCVLMLLVSLVILTTQAFNPFIYFIF